MIAYHILCHGNFKQVAMLVDSLFSTDDVFLIDIDDGQKPDLKPLEKYRNRSNVHISCDSNISWGGGGTLRKTIKGALFLLDVDRSWDYYVVLSGQDLPLQSKEQIKNRLSRGIAEKTSYIRAARASVLSLDDIPIDNKKNECVLWGDRGHTKVFAKPGTINPQVDFAARWLVDVAEIGEIGHVYVGRCDSLLLKRREMYFSKYPFHIGANWFNLHRSVIEHMQKDEFAYELYDVLKNTFIPDESYFQTYIKNSPFRDHIDNDYGRLILRPGPIPRVKVFGMEDLPAIESSNDLFGRKFDLNHDARVIKEVLERAA